jgi:hypothetical protein
MASNSVAQMINPDGYALPNPGNSITTKWIDKRSCTHVSLSFVLAGANAPTGTLIVQGSNAPENYGISYGSSPLGLPNPIDTTTITGTSTAITATGVTKFDLVTAERWVRMVYTSSADVSGLTVYAWASCPFESA